MDLWIRSQDRKILVKCNEIALTTDSEDMKTIRGYKIVGYFDKNTEYEELGFYTNKERALEVLDEIQNLLIPKTIVNTFNIEKKDMLNGNQYSIFENNIKDFSIEQFDTYVYKMPKE